MHTARQLSADSFSVAVDDKQTDLSGLFPGWGRADRFGIVVNEPFGMLGGANLLLQAAITSYYDLRRDTHAEVPTYPEVYLFHVGGPHGDYSMYDVQPMKEIRLGTNPWDLVVAIAERGITRLAVPDGQPSEFDYIHNPGGWFYGTALVDHLASVFAYSADGEVADHDVTLSTDDGNLLYNRRACLDLESLKVVVDATTPETLPELHLGYTSMEDIADYSRQVGDRANEVPLELRREISAKYADKRSEQLRRVGGEEALGLLKRSCEAVSGEFSGASPEFPYRAWQSAAAHS